MLIFWITVSTDILITSSVRQSVLHIEMGEDSCLSTNPYPVSTWQKIRVIGKGMRRSPMSLLVEETILVLFHSVPMAELNLKLMRHSGPANSSSSAFCFCSLFQN